MNSAIKAFRKPDLVVDELLTDAANFYSYDSRLVRYAILWAFYGNDVYDNIHSWAKIYKSQYELYRHIRNIYNPTKRIIDFWRTHLWGDLKFNTNENDQLSDDITQILNWSNWQSNRVIAAYQGSLFGDTFIKIVDDTDKDRVYHEIVHPGNIKELELDTQGNIKRYVLEEDISEPDQPFGTELYQEVVENVDGVVTYKTFKNGHAHNFLEDINESSEFELPYDFVPMIQIQHQNIGSLYGLSEIYSNRSKIHEADEQASLIGDYIRRQVRPPGIIEGATLPENVNTTTKRDDNLYLQGTGNAGWIPLTTDLDLEGSVNNLRGVLDELENEYPELALGKNTLATTGEKSGRSISEVRKSATSKVTMVRDSYDSGLIRANQMALTIAGIRGIVGGSYNLDSFNNGDLHHTIVPRTVFVNDEFDQVLLNLDKARTVRELTSSGASIEAAASVAGYTPEEVELLQQVATFEQR